MPAKKQILKVLTASQVQELIDEFTHLGGRTGDGEVHQAALTRKHACTHARTHVDAHAGASVSSTLQR
jgi:ribosomal protein S15P/S13E